MLKNVNLYRFLNINGILYDIIGTGNVRDVNFMLILAKSVLAIFIGFLVSVIFGTFFVPFMRKRKARQVTSKFVKAHKAKSGTPTMGGLIFSVSTIIAIAAMFITKKMTITTNLFIVLFVFFGFGLIGFVDDYFNCLTVGSVMRPLTDKHKISREKLAYLIDATAAPV